MADMTRAQLINMARQLFLGVFVGTLISLLVQGYNISLVTNSFLYPPDSSPAELHVPFSTDDHLLPVPTSSFRTTRHGHSIHLVSLYILHRNVPSVRNRGQALYEPVVSLDTQMARGSNHDRGCRV